MAQQAEHARSAAYTAVVRMSVLAGLVAVACALVSWWALTSPVTADGAADMLSSCGTALEPSDESDHLLGADVPWARQVLVSERQSQAIRACQGARTGRQALAGATAVAGLASAAFVVTMQRRRRVGT
ncbi:hypothetical protein LY13_004995 [Prauserella aidingensis]|nr:hypothetical protein [Prauserella aidingensis]